MKSRIWEKMILFEAKGRKYKSLLYKLDNTFYMCMAPCCFLNTDDQWLPNFWIDNQQTILITTHILSSLLLASSVKSLDSSIKHLFSAGS